MAPATSGALASPAPPAVSASSAGLSSAPASPAPSTISGHPILESSDSTHEACHPPEKKKRRVNNVNNALRQKRNWIRAALQDQGFCILKPTPKFPLPEMPEEMKRLLSNTCHESVSKFHSFSKEEGPIDHGRLLRKLVLEDLPQSGQDFVLKWQAYLMELHLDFEAGGGQELRILPSSLQALYTTFPGVMPQLLHTDHPLDLKPLVFSVIVAGDRAFKIEYSLLLWNLIKDRSASMKKLQEEITQLQAQGSTETSEPKLKKLQQQLKKHTEFREFTAETILNRDATQVVVEPGEAIIFRHDFPHLGASDARNWRLFFSFGSNNINTTDNSVQTSFILNHPAVIKLHDQMHFGARNWKNPKDAEWYHKYQPPKMP
jgi:hypothetical protein